MPKEKPFKLDQVSIRMVMDPPLYSDIPLTTPEAAIRVLRDVFKDYDAILSPTVCCLPPKNALAKGETTGPSSINGIEVDPDIGAAPTFLVNFVGFPAASVPIGLSSDSLPIGMHILCPKYQDALVLSIANAVEKIAPWNGFYSVSMNL